MDDVEAIACDFDGVLHNNQTPWVSAEVISDPPVEGAIEWLIEITKTFFVIIHTVRANVEGADEAIVEWLVLNGVPSQTIEMIAITAEKPNARMYIDDRAFQFKGPGTFPSSQEILSFTPWNKSEGKPEGPNGMVREQLR